MGSQNLIDIAAPLFTMDATTTYHSPEKLALARRLAQLGVPVAQIPTEVWEYVHPPYTLGTVRTKLQEMVDERRMAEEWAQASMQTLKEELQKNNDDAGKYRRVLNQQHIKDMQLTFGPPADKRNKYYNRFDIGDAEEFKVLKESYLKYLDMINLFEGRDLSPEGVLKASDYPTMFFDATKSYSVGASTYRACPGRPK